MDKLIASWKAIKAFGSLAWDWAGRRIDQVQESQKISRMLQWGILSVLMYAVVLVTTWPLVVQAALTKGANVNAGAFLGYWIDRTLFSGFDIKFDADPNAIPDAAKAARVVARAVIVAACVVGLSLGVGA